MVLLYISLLVVLCLGCAPSEKGNLYPTHPPNADSPRKASPDQTDSYETFVRAACRCRGANCADNVFHRHGELTGTLSEAWDSGDISEDSYKRHRAQLKKGLSCVQDVPGAEVRLAAWVDELCQCKTRMCAIHLVHELDEITQTIKNLRSNQSLEEASLTRGYQCLKQLSRRQNANSARPNGGAP